MANAAGWLHDGYSWISPKGKPNRNLPFYCSDRDTVPQMLDLIWDRKSKFCKELAGLLGKHEEGVGYEGFIHEILMDFLYCKPRVIAIAVLVTLRKWPAEWITE